VPLADLPRIDEHAVLVAATPEAVWNAALQTLHGASAGSTPLVARLLGCDPPSSGGWERPGVGSAVPGFEVVAADRPRLLAVAGSHRFSRYGIVLRIEPADGAVRCRAESRAAFLGVAGRLYRLAVVSTGGHAAAVSHLLARIRRAAESTPGPLTSARRGGQTPASGAPRRR
jgi:hypothetical protein